MKLILRKFALAATILAAGVMSAQVSVTQNWIKQGLPGAAGVVRSGSGYGGKCYLPAGTQLYTMDADGFKEVKIPSFSMNKGLAIDDAGNIIVASAFPTAANNWNIVKLISADFTTVTNLTLNAPEDVSGWGRYDVVGNAIGDFMSEEGGLFFLTSGNPAMTFPIPIWITNGGKGEQPEIANATTATFTAANTMASAVPSVSSMAEVDPDNVQNQFYYRTGGSCNNNKDGSEIGYVNSSGEAAKLPIASGMPAGWFERSQNGFAVFRLAGELYQVRMAGPANWTNCWVLTKENGETI